MREVNHLSRTMETIVVMCFCQRDIYSDVEGFTYYYYLHQYINRINKFRPSNNKPFVSVSSFLCYKTAFCTMLYACQYLYKIKKTIHVSLFLIYIIASMDMFSAELYLTGNFYFCNNGTCVL